MAIYPAGNPGAYPVDITTAVGQVRYTVGDTVSTAYDPVEAGYQNYEFFSDTELEVLLSMAGDSVPGAVGYAYLKFAGAAAGSAVDWASDDLRVTLSKTPAELRATASMWFERASVDSLGDDFFIVDTGIACDPVPELAGRYCYTCFSWPCGC